MHGSDDFSMTIKVQKVGEHHNPLLI